MHFSSVHKSAYALILKTIENVEKQKLSWLWFPSFYDTVYNTTIVCIISSHTLLMFCMYTRSSESLS